MGSEAVQRLVASLLRLTTTQQLKLKRCNCSGTAKITEGRWLRPALARQFKFVEWTEVNDLGYTKFIALRDDRKAKEVRRENS